MLDIFDYMSFTVDDSSSDLVLLFGDCITKKDLDCYPSVIGKGCRVDLISVNLNTGTMQFYKDNMGKLMQFADFEIDANIRLVEFT